MFQQVFGEQCFVLGRPWGHVLKKVFRPCPPGAYKQSIQYLFQLYFSRAKNLEAFKCMFVE